MAFNPGGAGSAASIAGSSDVTLSNPSVDQVLSFNAQTSKWQNKSSALVTTNQQTGNAYTLSLSDAGLVVETTSNSAVSLTVPKNSLVAFPLGMTISLRQYGSGQLTVVADTGVIIRSRGNVYKFAGQYAEAVLTKRSTDEWILSGDLVS
jgi:hypothetical protein